MRKNGRGRAEDDDREQVAARNNEKEKKRGSCQIQDLLNFSSCESNFFLFLFYCGTTGTEDYRGSRFAARDTYKGRKSGIFFFRIKEKGTGPERMNGKHFIMLGKRMD